MVIPKIKFLFLPLFSLFFSGCVDRAVIVPVDEIDYKDWTVTVPFEVSLENKREALAKYGIVYVGMPQEDLAKAGYTEDKVVDCWMSEGKKYTTFLDWTEDRPGALITVCIEDGKVTSWFKE